MKPEPKLFYNTISPQLSVILNQLMEEPLFSPFRLVGGTNLSLRFGHRRSTDIDLFTDRQYDSLNFQEFEQWLKEHYSYYDTSDTSGIVGFGRSYYIGNTVDDCIKLDLMYTDPFLNSEDTHGLIRMASIKDIIAMKMNAIFYGGRKKDFWDIHLLLQTYSLKEMIEIHKARHIWEHEDLLILERLQDFKRADEDFDPICFLGKNWDEIKLDIIDEVAKIK